MSVVGIRISAEIAELRGLQEALGQIFTDQQKTEILKKALKLAIEPTFLRLKELTPLGPTGNLKRAASRKVKPYAKDGNAVGLVGYNQAARADSASAAGGTVRAGKDRGFHQWWLENGTKERFVTKLSNTPYQRRPHTRVTRSGTVADVRGHQVSGQNAVIASSFKRLGPFLFSPTERPRPGSGSQRVQTDPALPQAFFKKGKKGESALKIERQPVGGSTGQPPLQTAWDQTKATAAEILQRELRLTLSQALESLARFPGTLSG
jgi:hypothetical protein